jgi:hypothetical protein
VRLTYFVPRPYEIKICLPLQEGEEGFQQWLNSSTSLRERNQNGIRCCKLVCRKSIVFFVHREILARRAFRVMDKNDDDEARAIAPWLPSPLFSSTEVMFLLRNTDSNMIASLGFFGPVFNETAHRWRDQLPGPGRPSPSRPTVTGTVTGPWP